MLWGKPSGGPRQEPMSSQSLAVIVSRVETNPPARLTRHCGAEMHHPLLAWPTLQDCEWTDAWWCFSALNFGMIWYFNFSISFLVFFVASLYFLLSSIIMIKYMFQSASSIEAYFFLACPWDCHFRLLLPLPHFPAFAEKGSSGAFLMMAHHGRDFGWGPASPWRMKWEGAVTGAHLLVLVLPAVPEWTNVHCPCPHLP